MAFRDGLCRLELQEIVTTCQKVLADSDAHKMEGASTRRYALRGPIILALAFRRIVGASHSASSTLAAMSASNVVGLFGSRSERRVACSGSYRPLGPQDRRHVQRTHPRPTIPSTSPTTSETANAVGCLASFRLRIRYRDLIGPWFEYLIVSPDEMAEIVEGTGWEIRHLIRDEDSVYVAVLEHPG